MRPVKFRAWHSSKQMIDWDSLQSHSMHFVFGYGTLTLMQYTGLLDRNGKEIYEGDIDGSDEPMYVAFEDGSFGLKFKGRPDYFDNCINWDKCEVIGNIYEHPHLLEATT